MRYAFSKLRNFTNASYFTEVTRLYQSCSPERATNEKSCDFSEVARLNVSSSFLKKHISSTNEAIELIPSSLCTTFHALSEFVPLKPLHFWYNKLHNFYYEVRIIGSNRI